MPYTASSSEGVAIVVLALLLTLLVFSKEPAATAAELSNAEEQLEETKKKIDQAKKEKAKLAGEKKRLVDAVSSGKKEYGQVKEDPIAKSLYQMWVSAGGTDASRHTPQLVDLFLNVFGQSKKARVPPRGATRLCRKVGQLHDWHFRGEEIHPHERIWRSS